MLAAFVTLVFPRASNAAAPNEHLLCATGPKAANPHSPTQNDAESQELQLRKAEVATERAMVLRQQQSEKGLFAALGQFKKGLGLLRSAHSNKGAADVDLQIGDIYFTLSRYKESLSSYHDALRLAGKDAELRCRALSRITKTYANTGRPPHGDLAPEQELRDCQGLSDGAQAEVLEAEGEALRDSDSSKSGKLAREALELFAQAGNRTGQAQSLLLLAYLGFRRDQAESRRLTMQALRLWLSAQDNDGAGQAYTALGIFARVTGDFERAQCNLERALPLFQRIGDTDNRAVVLGAMGALSEQTGDLEASVDDFMRARPLFAAADDQLGLVEAETGLGNTLIAMRRYAEALQLLHERLRLAQKTQNAAQIASTQAGMASIYEMRQQYAQAEALYSRSLTGYRSVHNTFGEGDVLIRLSHLRATRGRYSEAISLLEKAGLMKNETHQVQTTAKIQYELAYIYRKLNRLEDAKAAIQKTIDIIESERLKIADFDSRASYFASVHNYYALYIQILMLLHTQQPERGFMQLALEASEKSKVRALLDLLGSARFSPRVSCDEIFRKQLAAADSVEVPDPEIAPSVPATPVLTVEQIRDEIQDDDTVLVEYALGDEKSYAWIVDRNQAVAHELPGAGKIGKVVRLFRNALIARQPLPGEDSLGLDEYRSRIRKADAAYRVYAQQLAHMLLDPLPLDRAKRILIVPDGFLQYIPFSALPFSQSGEQRAMLITHHEVIILPSASTLNTLRKATAGRAPPTSLAAVFADPVFERDDPRVAHPHALVTKLEQKPPALKAAMRDVQQAAYIPRLPGSRDEANAIEEAFGKQDVAILDGFNASRDRALDGSLEHYKYIHFATHGIIDAQHPEMSGLILSLINRRGERQDGYLRLGDIYKLTLSADLVVLSGCNSALGKDLESEGIIGLPRGFLYAGARSVIASLWKVDDEAAAAFMKVFYERIQHGDTPGSALRGAQLEMSRNRRWSAPFYWAAFVLQGDYN